MAKISETLFALDDRVLHLSRKREELRTPEGWRRRAEQWRWFLGFACVLGVLMFLETEFGAASGLSALPIFGLACFRAGLLKGEADRLAGRGFFEKNRPAGL